MADELKIAEITVTPVRVPLSTTYEGGTYEVLNRCTIITRVRTEDGRVGEAYNGDTDAEQELVVRLIREALAPLLIGRDAWQATARWEDMATVARRARPSRKATLEAIACVDSAIWDLIGKAMGQPLSRVWGGARETVPIVAIGGYYSDEPDAIPREAERYLEMGIAGCKFKIGRRSPEEDAKRVRRFREAAGPDFVVAVDANRGYGVEEAVEFMRLAGDCDLAWFEEPCHWSNDVRWMHEVKRRTGVRVTAGQSEIGIAGVRGLLEAQAIDICNFDASESGGPTLWRRVAGLVNAYGARIGHHEEPQIAGQMLASSPDSTYVECFLPERDPVFWNMIANRPEIAAGLFHVPQGPGWGLELDPDWVARYTVA